MKCLAEKWRPVIGYEEQYEVSNLGRVASIERVEFYPSKLGKMFVRVRPYKVLKLSKGKTEYPTVGLHKNGETKRKAVHRLVAEAFIPNPKSLPEVNHIDETRDNNHVSNLEWVTRSENALHSSHKNRGERQSYLTEEAVLEIAALLGTMPQTEIATRFGTSNHVVHKIKCGKNWGWLTGLGKEGSSGALSH